jgi:hypothetical protein
MSLSDCEKCWSTPCRCGHKYRDWKLDDLLQLHGIIQRVIQTRTAKSKVNLVGKTIAKISECSHDVTFWFTDGTFAGLGVDDEQMCRLEWFDSSTQTHPYG